MSVQGGPHCNRCAILGILYVVGVPGLKPIRLRASLSQRELAHLSGVAASTIARIEMGHDAHPRTVRRLAEALKREPADLMELDK
jgi:transcriptional regulator with XRE-family HTH domain